MDKAQETVVGSLGGKERGAVLVIDDHGDAREMIMTLLGRLGRSSVGAASGAEALGVLEASPEAFGLALVDIILPDTDGMRLARELKRRNPRLGVVLLSGQLDEESRWVVSEEGFRFLPKPFSLKSLDGVLGEVLGDFENRTG